MSPPYEWQAGYQDVQYEIPGLNHSPRSPVAQEAEPMLAPGLPGSDKPDDHTFPHPNSLFMPPQYGPEQPVPAFHPPPLKSRASDPELGRRPSGTTPQQNSLSSHSSHSKPHFVPSPLNPSTPNYPSTAPLMPPLPGTPRRFSSYAATPQLRQLPSEDSRVLSWAPGSTPLPSPSINRGSMILYRWASDDDQPQLTPPKIHDGRHSRASTISYSIDSKYPTAAATTGSERGLIAYAYDPIEDDDSPPDNEDLLHDPRAKDVYSHEIPWRGFFNLSVLLLLLGAIITLFVGYPVISMFRDDGKNARIVGNTKINSTGQASGEDVPVRRRGQFPIGSAPVNADNKVYRQTFSTEFDDDKGFPLDSLWRYIAPTATEGAAISQETAGAKSSTVDIFQLRYPLCLGQGFLEVGFVTGGRATRLFWDGRWHEQTPPSPSRVRNTSLDVRISTEDPVSSSSELRYIRVYQAGWPTVCEQSSEKQILRLGTRVRDYYV